MSVAHHPIFQQFSLPELEPPHLGFDEEYFEWIDLLEAVVAAGETFSMLELGAGYGRWSARGALAARQLGKGVRLGLAEAEPKHQAWARRHLAENGVAGSDYRLFEAAVGGTADMKTFCVDDATSGEDWFGQFVTSWNVGDAPTVGDYYGRPLLDIGLGRRAIRVPQIPLSEVLEPYRFVDLADFDLQGSEADAIEEAIAALNTKVRRLHIGTHGEEIEQRLREVLTDNGWICLRDFSVAKENETPFGRIGFCDGVQSWTNPRLS
jgi:FkbM family methyltransferase